MENAMDQKTLTKFLQEEGILIPVEELVALVQGVAAAPKGIHPTKWMTLITASPSQSLERALADLLQEATEKKQHVQPTAARLTQLREVLEKTEVDGFIVPRADEYQGEYVPKCAQRLAWLTGFTGSAGTAVVLENHAAVFVDGRYTLQAEVEIDPQQYQVVSIGKTSVNSWLRENLCAGKRLGFDPKLHTRTETQGLKKACHSVGANLIGLSQNPLDSIWKSQPAAPISPVVAHDEIYAGVGLRDKCAQIAANISRNGSDAVVLTMTDSIAWLLNLRGGDVEFTPLPLSFAILHKDTAVDLFIDKRKLVPSLSAHLGNHVTTHTTEAFGSILNNLKNNDIQIQIDPATASEWIHHQLQGGTARVFEDSDPCSLPKAVKNNIELEGSRAAHSRDGVALTKFLHWLEETSIHGHVTELEASDKLEAFRREGKNFQGLSFPTIAGAGEHGAIVHYRVDEESNRPILSGELFLVDSGAQYLDGTTDVTRTVAIGSPTKEMKDRFTRVLKGHIAIATATFPTGTVGGQLDTLARQSLWSAGLDYNHGTGHGVGSFLSVHEGPHRISKGFAGAPLEPGMIVSNEPGYYKTNEYGIRIENLVTVVKRDRPKGGELDVLGFETLTLSPIDLCLIEKSLLVQEEKDWLNSYHTTVREALTPLLTSGVAGWLQRSTQPI